MIEESKLNQSYQTKVVDWVNGRQNPLVKPLLQLRSSVA